MGAERIDKTDFFSGLTHAERMAALWRSVCSPAGGAMALTLMDQIKREIREAENIYDIHLIVTGKKPPEEHR